MAPIPSQLKLIAAIACAIVMLTPAGALAGAPLILESWTTEVTATSANLRAKINPNGPSTTYRFEFVTQAAFEASGYAGAAKMPPSGAAPLGSGSATLAVVLPLIAPLNPLVPATAYRYRPVASNSEGTTTGTERLFTTQAGGQGPKLPDGRAWEMVSPVDKGGGAIAAPGALFGGGEFQASRIGAAVTYSSATAFDTPPGAPPASQYVSVRTAAGWATQNVSTPLESAAYGDHPDGAPYRVFSTDLSRALLFGGLPCGGVGEGCPAPNPVLPGTGAPEGFMAYYLREGSSGSFGSLLGTADLEHTSVSPQDFEVSFAAASPDLSRIVLSSCAKLTANATELLLGGGCDPAEANLYRWDSAGLSLLNLLPGAVIGSPSSQVAAPLGAISIDGSRVYWTHGGNLYLREGSQSVQVDEAQGGGGVFQGASADGGIAFFTKAGHLYRFSAVTEASADLTAAGGVLGVLGAAADGSTMYFQDAEGIERWHDGAVTLVAAGVDAAAPSDYPPATGTSRVSPDGSHLAFLSKAGLTGYDNASAEGGAPYTELYLYGPLPAGGAPKLICVSCNPTGERPEGPSSIPGALINGTARAYRPRALSDDGSRLFFDSADDVGSKDTNSQPDVYQWEAQGSGDCQRSPGCVSLISNGRSPAGARFIDANGDGSDVYFTTDASLVGGDPGSVDLYDARVGGGFAEIDTTIECIGDRCQPLPSSPDDPDPGSLVKNEGNPLLRYLGNRRKAKQPKHGRGRNRKRHRRAHAKLRGEPELSGGRRAAKR
jgi:hypothetical protein